MNDTTRELGAALGVAVLGSVAASRYSSGIADAISGFRPRIKRRRGRRSAGPCRRRRALPQAIGAELASAAEHAFVSGIHFAAITGAVLAAGAALMVLRFLPRHIVQQGATHDVVSAAEDMAELGLGGALPVFADTPLGDDDAVEVTSRGATRTPA